jgi:hypothetical protein
VSRRLRHERAGIYTAVRERNGLGELPLGRAWGKGRVCVLEARMSGALWERGGKLTRWKLVAAEASGT